jgi:hypothetical protein
MPALWVTPTWFEAALRKVLVAAEFVGVDRRAGEDVAEDHAPHMR